MSRYIDIINGKTGALADARRKWKRRIRKYKSRKVKPIYRERIPN